MTRIVTVVLFVMELTCISCAFSAGVRIQYIFTTLAQFQAWITRVRNVDKSTTLITLRLVAGDLTHADIAALTTEFVQYDWLMVVLEGDELMPFVAGMMRAPMMRTALWLPHASYEALREASRTWDLADWQATTHRHGNNVGVKRLIEDAVLCADTMPLEHVSHGLQSSALLPLGLSAVHWADVQTALRDGRITLVETRVSVSVRGAPWGECVIWRARGTPIWRLWSSAYAHFAITKGGSEWTARVLIGGEELADLNRSLEDYGVDDDTEVCVYLD